MGSSGRGGRSGKDLIFFRGDLLNFFSCVESSSSSSSDEDKLLYFGLGLFFLFWPFSSLDASSPSVVSRDDVITALASLDLALSKLSFKITKTTCN